MTYFIRFMSARIPLKRIAVVALRYISYQARSDRFVHEVAPFSFGPGRRHLPSSAKQRRDHVDVRVIELIVTICIGFEPLDLDLKEFVDMPMHDWTRVRSGVFHNFHVLWMSTITNRLNSGLLPRGFLAMAEQVVGGTEPDVVALKFEDMTRVSPDLYGSEGGLAVADAVQLAPPRPQTSFVIAAETERYALKTNRVVIRHHLGRVVAIVEIVSPSNKDSQHAMRSFVEKSVDLLFEGINLLVIDPFPPGPRDPQGIHKAIWDQVTDQPFELPADRPLTIAAYQASPIKTAYIEPIALGSPLPEMPLFLHGDYYIPAPLEATYMDTWNALPQALRDLVL